MPRTPRRRPVLRAPEPLSGVLDRAEGAGAPAGRPNVSMRDWAAAVGARIAERAQPIELDRGTLIVRVATSVWASELSLLAQPILERLLARGVKVQALRYRVGVIEAPVRAKAFRATRVVPAPLPLPAGFDHTLLAVADEELRAVIGDAARANLAWQAYVAPGDGLPAPTSAASRAARVPRSSETESDLPDRTTGAAPGAPRRRP